MNDNIYLPFIDEKGAICRLSFKVQNIPATRIFLRIMHEKMYVDTRGYYLHINLITFNEFGVEFGPDDHKVIYVKEAQRHSESAYRVAAEIASGLTARAVNRLYPDVTVDWNSIVATPSKPLSPVAGIYMDKIHHFL